MLSTTLSAALQRRGLHYAWVVAAVTFIAMLTTSAALGLPGAMLQPLSKEFGWTTDQLSSVFAVRFALFGLLGPFAAILIARFGLPRIMVAAASFIAVAMVLATGITQLWQLFLLWGLVLGCGTGLTALVLGAMVASRWFTANRGLVVGLFAASTATGQLIFLPLAAWLIEHHGWRYAVIPIFVACMVVIVLVTLLMRNHPSELGLLSLGEPEGTPLPPVPAPAPLNFLGPFRVLAEAVHHRSFWILALSFFICGLSTNGLLQTHFISLCSDNGLSAVPAASVLSMMGAFDLVGTHAVGLPVRPLRQPQAAVLVLRAARAVAVLAALLHLHAVRPGDLRDVLRAGLDRHRAADGEAGGTGVRQGTRRHDLRLGVRLAPTGRGGGSLRRGTHAHAAAHLQPGTVRGRRGLPGGGRGGDDDPAAGQAGHRPQDGLNRRAIRRAAGSPRAPAA